MIDVKHMCLILLLIIQWFNFLSAKNIKMIFHLRDISEK